MGKNKHPIPNKSAKLILEKAGAKRVSKDASEEFARNLEELAVEISKRAIEIARHAKRKTIIDKDIKLAAKLMK